MSIEVLGCWEYAWQCPLREHDLWVHMLKEFGINSFNMYPVSGIQKNVKEVADVTSFIQNSDKTVVFVDEAADIELPEFIHPKDALYVAGKTTFSPYITSFDPQKHTAVKIPSVRNTGGFWGHQAISMVLYDRFLKEQQWQ